MSKTTASSGLPNQAVLGLQATQSNQVKNYSAGKNQAIQTGTYDTLAFGGRYDNLIAHF